MKIIKPPQKLPLPKNSRSWVFLAGTIDNGNSIDWQQQVSDALITRYNIMNPRRENWDASWEQKFTDPRFSQQVNWELDMLDRASIIVFHFEKDSKSPITLLELGYYLGKKKPDTKLVVSCPEGYWRKGNVDIICDREGVPVFEDLNILINYLKAY